LKLFIRITSRFAFKIGASDIAQREHRRFRCGDTLGRRILAKLHFGENVLGGTAQQTQP
jgi:hypothetical protein